VVELSTSILIVNYKTGQLLDKCVSSIKENTEGSYEILVHDNSPPLPNLGFTRANNLLLQKAKGKYIVLLNPDTEVTSGWLNALIERAESDARIGIVQPKLLLPNGLIDTTGHGWLKWGVPYDRGSGEVDRGQYDNQTELSSCCFACALIKRQVFRSIGALDERLFIFFEDVEFCLRAKRAGWRVLYCPTSTVYHVKHGSGASTFRFYMPYVALKNLGVREYLRIVGFVLLGIPTGLKNADWPYTKKKIQQLRDSFFI
jgi:GT2 family glycosyltransferase